MKPSFTEDDFEYLTEEAERLRCVWSETGILAKSLKHCRGAVLGSAASADAVAGAAVSSLLHRKPLSMVRVGDGED